MRLPKWLAATIGVAALVVFAGTVLADTLELTPPPIPTVSPKVGGANFTYKLDLTDMSEVQPTDFFVFIDFPGFDGTYSTAGLVNAANWSVVIEPKTNMAGGVPLVTDTNLPNVRVVYNGPTIANATGSPLPMGTFTIGSTLPGTVLQALANGYGDKYHFSPFPVLPNFDVENLAVPAAVPLPSTALGFGALLGLMGLSRIRRR